MSEETTQWQGLGVDRRPSDLKSNALTITPPRPLPLAVDGRLIKGRDGDEQGSLQMSSWATSSMLFFIHHMNSLIEGPCFRKIEGSVFREALFRDFREIVDQNNNNNTRLRQRKPVKVREKLPVFVT